MLILCIFGISVSILLSVFCVSVLALYLLSVCVLVSICASFISLSLCVTLHMCVNFSVMESLSVPDVLSHYLSLCISVHVYMISALLFLCITILDVTLDYFCLSDCLCVFHYLSVHIRLISI